MGRTKLNIITDKRVAYSKALLMPIKSVDIFDIYRSYLSVKSLLHVAYQE